MSTRILIADDDAVQRRLIENMVQRFGYEAVVVDSGDAALATLISPDAPTIDAVVLDLVMPGLDGMGVLSKMREAGIATPVIVQTAHGGIDNVVSAMRAGAQDFVVKPVGAERLQVSLRNALTTSALKGELQRIRHSREGRLTFRDIVTRSEAMDKVLRMARKAAGSGIPVLIEGESGVGKELIARAIHGSSERSSKPFVAVNCGAIPDNLVESILFGHEKGAFTGATEKHAGKFVEASGGTLFLDEVSELPLSAQVKLLRALQEGEVEAVGGRRPVKVDVRIISATNRQLLDRVKAGYFREDLFYRLHVLPLTVPPLRNRREDIPHLLRHFLARFCAEENRHITSVDGNAIALLAQADWPGNVRQLENTVYRAVVMSEGDQLGIADFPQVASQSGMIGGLDGMAEPPVHLAPPVAPLQIPSASPPVIAAADVPIAPPLPVAGTLSMLAHDGEVRPLEDMEAEIIRFAISYYRGQMSEVARRLKIGRSTLYRKLDDAVAEPAAGSASASDRD
ncbi:sigma-54-dependent Fis family transcriptional regulator [Bradyrhizobium sp. U87765 SZCCT0131]|uniref:sigma-54-dependent transcriptional regulator n=1 Tax=unclassified Bradyrhizobium TaxID=2631580 RepID=UPI001BA7291D|nr:MULTISPECIES: sigma-54 dependent transcriptional regulator [unclassified Bradyrhizobium]MBR1221937.1 sigma-54-dependent Fis family transcriptional regulator [Bradyrhizobium sp. U87765 SZCCT0131]MBR1263865.1 sigma-54-dependent Fis family transcriptional regulator [Bradyrhizobium sp. U87765 SZCCT0134]MBR1302565.1 sigma-54-dependent Fis family transcriptional regulator [Bradyrhizobium sp. U87765 SZCCT0110]MBR1320115.1 sigma-54-dependent Fis family transcriptional regulator [Bradyrhizobium sp. U